MQALSWTTEGFSAAKLKKAEIEWSSRDTLDVAKKVCVHNIQLRVCVPTRGNDPCPISWSFSQRSQRIPPDLKKPLFQIIPDKFLLQPYQSQVVTLHGCSPMYVEQSASSRHMISLSPSFLLPPLSPSSLQSPGGE